MRTAHVSELDYAWGYTSILARAVRKMNYAKYGVPMNLVLHSTHTWVRNVLDKVRTYRGSDRKSTSFEHSVKAHKQPVVVPANARMSAVNVAMTAKRESVRDYDKYLGLEPPRPGNAIVLDEDIKLLIETLNLCFGSRYSQLKSVQTWSNFANRDVVRADCGATKLGDVWAGVPKWVESLTTTSSDRPEPSIFEPPDVDDRRSLIWTWMTVAATTMLCWVQMLGMTVTTTMVATIVVVRAGACCLCVWYGCDVCDVAEGSGGDGSNDGDRGGSGGGDAGGGGDAWSRRAANQWMKTYPCGTNDKEKITERRRELVVLFGRSSRGRNLAAKRSREALERERAEEEAAIASVARAEAQELIAAQIDWEVEEIRGKWVDDGGAAHYRVKWLNHPSSKNSWEKARNLQGSEMLITKFEEKFKSVKNPVVSIHQYTQTGRKKRRRKKR